MELVVEQLLILKPQMVYHLFLRAASPLEFQLLVLLLVLVLPSLVNPYLM